MYTSLRPVLIARRFNRCHAVHRAHCSRISPMSQVQAQSSGQKSQQPQQPDQAAPDSAARRRYRDHAFLKKRDVPEERHRRLPRRERKVKNPEELGAVSLRLEVPEVTVDVAAAGKDTSVRARLKPDNFHVYEDGVEQKVIGFKRVEAPITALMVCEFASNNYWWIKGNDMRNAAYAFMQQLRPQDYVAMMTFDMRTQIVTDFTQDKGQLMQALNTLQIPGFSRRNVFDALYESIDRLERIEGQKYIILIGTGLDTFSKLTFDKILARVKTTHDITIFTISTGGALRAITEGRGGMESSIRDMDYLQADNEMKTFSSLTGGMSFFPRFAGEMPEIFGDINANIRSKYEIIYRPTNSKQDGTYRKLRVALVDDEGQPLKFQDQKHKPLKYDIITRDGYRAKQAVE